MLSSGMDERSVSHRKRSSSSVRSKNVYETGSIVYRSIPSVHMIRVGYWSLCPSPARERKSILLGVAGRVFQWVVLPLVQSLPTIVQELHSQIPTSGERVFLWSLHEHFELPEHRTKVPLRE